MTVPEHRAAPADARNAKLLRAAIWVAVGALIAAAIVCVVWVLVGSQSGIIGRAFLTILLLAAFAGVSLLDARLAPTRRAWFALASMSTWVLSLLIGAFLIWMPDAGYISFRFGGIGRFMSFLLIVLVLQLALLHVSLFEKAIARASHAFTRVVGYVTIGLVVLLAVMVVLPLMLYEWVDFYDLYWRIMVAVAILAAVGTAIVPLVSVMLSPRRRVAAPPALRPWPTYADGVTPLPVLPDGAPDWNAYYTGYPTYVAPQVSPAQPQAASLPHAAPPVPPPAQPAPEAPPAQAAPPAGYEGFPPPPPLPPRG